MIAALGLLLFSQTAQAQWTPAKRLTWNSGNSLIPAWAIDSSGTIHLVWQDSTPGYYDIFYKKSTDEGSTWTDAQRLTWTSGDSEYPAIAVDSSDDLHLVWMDEWPGNGELYYMKSTDGGDSWSKSKRLTWNSGGSYEPVMAVDSSDNLHLLWYDYTPGSAQLYYKRSTDRGATWSASQRLVWNSDPCWHPDLAAYSSGHLYVVWMDFTAGNYEIFLKTSTDGGVAWSASRRLTWTSGWSFRPQISVGPSGDLHLVWDDETPGNDELFYRTSTDGGAAWSTSRRLTWTSGDCRNPAMAFESPTSLHLFWDDNTPGKEEIYYKRSTDAGATWSTSQRLTWTAGNSWYPAIAVVSSGRLHLFWSDNTPGNWEIYYKKFIK